MLVLLNIGEHDLGRADEMAAELAASIVHARTSVVPLSARIEMEIGQLDEEEADVFREDLGLEGSSLERVIRASYSLLGLISFFTVGPDETRAWTVARGATAVDAPAAIHSDLARGFIRAEVIGWQDLLELGSMAEAKRTASCARRARPTRCRTATSSRSSSTSDPRRWGMTGGPGHCSGEPVVAPDRIIRLDIHEQRPEVLHACARRDCPPRCRRRTCRPPRMTR